MVVLMTSSNTLLLKSKKILIYSCMIYKLGCMIYSLEDLLVLIHLQTYLMTFLLINMLIIILLPSPILLGCVQNVLKKESKVMNIILQAELLIFTMGQIGLE